MSWDKELEARYKLLSDTTAQGQIRLKVARAAFAQYDKVRSWDNVNPEVREDWLTKIKAVMDALKEGLVISN